MKSLLIYININNLITTKNCEPIFTKRPTISKQLATLLTKESQIEISNQQPKNEVMRNLAVGLDCGRSTMGLVAWWRPQVLLVPLLILSPFLHNQTPLVKERKGAFQLQTHPQFQLQTHSESQPQQQTHPQFQLQIHSKSQPQQQNT